MSHTSSVKTALDSRDESDSSIRTEAGDSPSILEEVEEESYTQMFDDSITSEESFRQVLPSEAHRRKELRRQSGENSNTSNAIHPHNTATGRLLFHLTQQKIDI